MLEGLKRFFAHAPVQPIPAAAPVVLPSPKGFFSTDRGVPTDDDSLGTWAKRFSPVVFQRTVADDVHVSVSMAQDSGDLIVKTDTKFALDNSVKDVFGFAGGGSPMPYAQVSWYASQSFIGYQMCATMLQHWFIDKACTMPARDAIRNGYDITRDDGESLTPQMVNEFKKLDKRFKVKSNCVEAVRKCRAFGIRVVLFVVDSPDPDYYIKPFNPDGVQPGSYKGISQVDPYWITPELDGTAASDPSSIHFYEPTFWRINGKRYHRSHLVVIRTNEVPDVLKPTYFYGGVPLPQVLYERCYAAERTTNEGPQLALTKRTTVIEGVDMAAAMKNPAAFKARIAEWAYFRDNYGVRVSGGSEEVKQFDTALNDVDVVIMTQWQLACAIAEVPATKMLGTMPKGFNATGEYEESSYHEALESIQEHDMEPIIARHHLLCMYSNIMPKFKLNAPFVTGIDFAELDSETASEKAERTSKEAERDLRWAQSGAIDGTDIRGRLIKDKDSGYTGIETVEPEGPTNRQAVQPGAPTTAPNTPPGNTPSSAPATVAATAPTASTADMAALDAAVAEIWTILLKRAT